MNTVSDTPTIKDESWKVIKDLRRKKLIALSEQAREIREEEGLDCTLNSLIIERFYQNKFHQEFHTFGEWKKQGFSIVKGSEAFVIWGRKRTVEAAQQNPNESEEEKKYKFFPLAYLFSNQQVKK